MATTITTARNISRQPDGELAHRVRLTLAIAAAVSLVGALSFWGFAYYRLGVEECVESDLHPVLRSTGAIGLRLGMLGVCLFVILFLYPLRKRWKWLASIGKTRHWLDFHALVGITAPIVITFHSAFKFRGIAGVAYWIMAAVALSGFVGRYLYAQIPRSLNAAQLSMGELEAQARELTAELERQCILPVEALAPLLRLPTPADVYRMSLLALFWTMLRLDLARPLLVSRLRRRVLIGAERFTTLGGLFKSGHVDLEAVIAGVRRQSWLGAKMAFLDRIHQAFHLWHVLHRPFSISFVALALVHIGVALMLGYY